MNTTIDRDKAFQKLKACIVYACSKDAKQERKLDHIKLNKVLWYADCASYMETGKSISHVRYIRKPNGPVARLMNPAMAELHKENQVKGGKKFDEQRGAWADTYEYVGAPVDDQDDARDADDADDAVKLNDGEKKYIDRAFHGVCAHSTPGTSDRTHGEVWEIAQNGEDLPLYAMFAERIQKIEPKHIAIAFGA